MSAKLAVRIPTRLTLLVSCFVFAIGALSSPISAGPGGQTELSGKLEVVHGDAFGGGHGPAHEHGSVPDHVLPKMQYWLDTGHDKLLLEFQGYPPPATSGARVAVRGERHGRAFHVSELRYQAAAGGGGGGKGKPSKPPATSYVGVRDVLVIAINFASKPQTPYTIDEIRQEVFTGSRSAANYVAETSFGMTTLKGENDGTIDGSDRDGATGDVAGWFTVNESTNSCDYQSWATAARNAAAAAGWDLSGYEHLAYVFPKVEACNWGGLGMIGGRDTWYNGWNKGSVYAHEFGHNFTLFHARTLSCTASGQRVVLSSSCSYLEYGDPFDVMGQSGQYRHYNIRNKGHLSWLGTANVATATSGQAYRIYPLETASSGIQLLRLRRSKSEYFYIEARTTHGEFDSFTPGADVVTGALIHTGPDLASNGNSYLLDTAPYPPPAPDGAYAAEFFDAALQAGEALVDTRYGISIETIGVQDDGSVTVLVRTGVNNTPPTADAGTSHTIPLGLSHTHEGASAGDTTKNLSSYRWSWVSCPGTCPALSATAGQLSGGADSVPGPSYTPSTAGTYRLSLTVWDAAGASTVVTLDELATG